VAQHCVGHGETARYCDGGAGDRGWGSMRNGGEPTRFYTGVDAGNIVARGKKRECGHAMKVQRWQQDVSPTPT
jgi:hypothetical protein